MRLLIGNESLRIAEMGPDFLLIDAKQRHAPCQATVVLRVNSAERRWEVYLPQGVASGGMQEVIATLPVGRAERETTVLEEVSKD